MLVISEWVKEKTKKNKKSCRLVDERTLRKKFYVTLLEPNYGNMPTPNPTRTPNFINPDGNWSGY